MQFNLSIRLYTDILRSLNQYFNGKCTDDEILYKADISRKHLREVLHYYNEYVGISSCTGFAAPDIPAVADIPTRFMSLPIPFNATVYEPLCAAST